MGEVRITPLGGAGEIGKNCTVLEQGDDLIVIDVGLSFPSEEMLGVDIVIPDFRYILERRDHLRGIFITHAHEDHVGALAYLLPHVKCPVYGTQFTLALAKMKLDEKLDTRSLDLRVWKPGDIVEAGSLTVEPIGVTHSIPDACALAIGTTHGCVLFTGDFKLDFTPVDGKLTNVNRLAELGHEGVVALFSDSTNVDRPGWGPSEREATVGFRKTFLEAPGRVLITQFASNVHRMQQVLNVAAETGRKVAVAGRRMEQTLDLCERLEYVTTPRGVRIPLDQVTEYRPESVAILTTGSQGEPMSALSQMSRQEYARLSIVPGDTVLYSARPIPGNEAAIWRVVNRLVKMGANVVYESPVPIHVSGHGYQEELKMMINLTRPYYLAPLHGEPRHLRIYRDMALEMGYPEHRLFTLYDGMPLVLGEQEAWIDEPIDCGRVLVDNAGNPGVTDDVLRDRSSLGNDGVVVVTVVIDVDRGHVVGTPILQTKGFSGANGAIEGASGALQDALASMAPAELADPDAVRRQASDAVRRFLARRTQLRPLVVAAVVEV